MFVADINRLQIDTYLSKKTNKKILLRYTFPTYDLKLFKRLTDVKCGIDYDLLVIGISPL